jgi:hypothetical protein
LTARNSERWIDILPTIVLTYNITRHSGNNITPFEAYYGEKPWNFWAIGTGKKLLELTEEEMSDLSLNIPDQESEEWMNVFNRLKTDQTSIATKVLEKQYAIAKKMVERDTQKRMSKVTYYFVGRNGIHYG